MEKQTSYLNLEKYFVHMTEFARYIADQIGLPATATLLHHYGGKTISISRSPDSPSQRKLALEIGGDAAMILGKLSDGQPITVPFCAGLLRAKRDDDIRTEFDRL